ncbi:MAG TPA: hypothetical protein VEB22_03275 [Phycisphaerales bacterium]|nr:hypothetical protein [Phycisphaerales bacterium]
MSGWTIGLMVAAMLAVELVVMGAIISFCTQVVRPLAAAYPAVEPAADAVRRRFQSFSFDFVSFGRCVHVAVDARYLHLRPASLARWLGMRDMSVPWGAIAVKKMRRRSAVASLGKTTVRGPAWCLSLAAPAQKTV